MPDFSPRRPNGAIIRVRRLFTRRIRLWKLGLVPLWAVVLFICGVWHFNKHHLLSSPMSGNLPNYLNRRYEDKFDLRYEPNDKRKVKQRWIGTKVDEPFQIGCVEPEARKGTANATLVVLARNLELDGVIKLVSTLERRFNQWFNYPWVFLNDEPFTDYFKDTVKQYTKLEVEFGEITREMWNFPLTQDEEASDQSPKHFNYFEFYEYLGRQGDRGIMYGNMELYHKMCRFYLGGFYRHPLVAKYEWYWRVEPNVDFFCDLTYDPFVEMERKGKKYGFTVIIKELSDTIPNLFRYTKLFIKENNIDVRTSWNLFVEQLNSFDFKGVESETYEQIKNIQEVDDLIIELEKQVQIEHLLATKKGKGDKKQQQADQKLYNTLVSHSSRSGPPKAPGDVFEGEKYNYCHFWSNFEIARVDVWNNPKYNEYFDYLDRSGGFFKERWGDAPVHSLGVAMFMDLDEIHYFRDIGYKHSTIAHCPHNSFDNQLKYGPSPGYFKAGDPNKLKSEDSELLSIDKPKKNGVGCRCKCPKRQNEIEDTGGSCIEDWIRATKYAELKKYDTANHRPARRLGVKKLKDLIAKDYQYELVLQLGKISGKYKSSAWNAFKEVKRLEEDENTKYTPDEFDQRLMELTVTMVNEKRLQIEENRLFKEAIG